MKIQFCFSLVIVICCITSCSKSDNAAHSENPSSAITVPTLGSTTVATTITATNAVTGGQITSSGGVPIISMGVCWSTSPNPTITNSTTFNGSGTFNNPITFSSRITGLNTSTLYYVRAYATNGVGTSYGNQISFTTSSILTLPTLTTTDLSLITASSATSGAIMYSDGGADVTARGVCWNNLPNPTTANAKTTDGTGFGSFTSNLTGLTGNTIYYLRSYATNSVGTAYGNELIFRTLEPGTVYIGGDNDNSFYKLDALTGQLKWKYTSTNGFSYSGACVINNKIYVGGKDGFLYCLDNQTGTLLWRFQAGNIGIESDPVYDNGIIYFGSNDDYLYAIDANTGVMKWRFLTGGNVSSSPAISNGVVYVGSSDSKVYAVNASTGLMVWSYQTGDLINQSGPSLSNGILYIGSRDGYCYALAMNDGSLKWKYKGTGSFEFSSPTVVNNVVYIAGSELITNLNVGGVYALNAVTGQLLWQQFQAIPFNSSPVVSDGKLFLASSSGYVYAMNPTDGSVIWTKSVYSNGANPAVMNGIVYIGGGGQHNIFALNAADGSEKWRYPIPNSIRTSGPCIVTPTSVSYSGKSGMQQ